jgi:PAS domain S-box-containing protein
MDRHQQIAFKSKVSQRPIQSIPTIKAVVINIDEQATQLMCNVLEGLNCEFSMVIDVEESDFDSEVLIFVAAQKVSDAINWLAEHSRGTGQRKSVITIVASEFEGAYSEIEAARIDDIIHAHENEAFVRARVKLTIDRAIARGQRWLAEDSLRSSTAQAKAVLETTVDGIITIDEKGIIQAVNPAVEKIFGYLTEELIGSAVSILMPEPVRSEHPSYIHNYIETGHRKIIGIGREVVGRRKDGSLFPLDLAVSDVTVGDRMMFTGVLRDISERRELEREILRISDAERQRIGHDLHDGLGQMLTGIGLITQSLAKRIEEKDVELAADIAEVSSLVKDADQQARTIARNLAPVDVEGAGLNSALSRLAFTSGSLFDIACRYESNGAVDLDDNTTATHLYRIAQEAISNAVTHGAADVVLVEFSKGTDMLRLRIKDNGSGFTKSNQSNPTRGMGVHIMNYRAKMIGGTLEIGRLFEGGTVVTCTVRLDVNSKSSSTSRITNQ